jgi:hypothetical protein
MAGKSIRLFLVDGRPEGILTAEIGNWTGRITVTPRTDLSDFVGRPDAKRTGVYILVGPDPSEKFDDSIYIGEGDNVYNRLYAHSTDSSKEFWTKAIVVTSKDENLTKAHVRYLESRLIDIATQAQRSQVTNSTAPTPPSLPEPDVADMDFFLDQTLQTLPVLGFDHLVPVSASARNAMPDGNHDPRFVLKAGGVEAHAVEIGGEFVALKGSTSRKEQTLSMTNYLALRARLTSSDLFADSPDPKLYVLTEDIPFRSPSAAAAVLLGGNTNGRTAWKVEGSAQTYADWQEANAPSAETEL